MLSSFSIYHSLINRVLALATVQITRGCLVALRTMLTGPTRFQNHLDPVEPLNPMKENILSVKEVLENYCNQRFIATDRVRNVTKLMLDIQSANSVVELKGMLTQAKIAAQNSDAVVNKNTLFFKRNFKGSRYQLVLDTALLHLPATQINTTRARNHR
jgi:hypothetical protein